MLRRALQVSAGSTESIAADVTVVPEAGRIAEQDRDRVCTGNFQPSFRIAERNRPRAIPLESRRTAFPVRSRNLSMRRADFAVVEFDRSAVSCRLQCFRHAFPPAENPSRRLNVS